MCLVLMSMSLLLRKFFMSPRVDLALLTINIRVVFATYVPADSTLPLLAEDTECSCNV
jgi:hypothetical protein